MQLLELDANIVLADRTCLSGFAGIARPPLVSLPSDLTAGNVVSRFLAMVYINNEVTVGVDTERHTVADRGAKDDLPPDGGCS
jgi:hypothetical protein